MPSQKISRCIGAIHLEALMRAAVLFREPHVMKHGAGVEQIGIEAKPTLPRGNGAEIVDPTGMVKNQLRRRVTDQFSHFSRQNTVRHLDAANRRLHDCCP